MTDNQCLKQTKKLMGTWQKGGLNVLMKEAERLTNSGGIDLSEEEEDSFYAAKIILHVALDNLSKQYAPFSEAGCEVAENLKEF